MLLVNVETQWQYSIHLQGLPGAEGREGDLRCGRIVERLGGEARRTILLLLLPLPLLV